MKRSSATSIKRTMIGIRERFKKEQTLCLLQARIDRDIYFQFRRQLRKDKVSIKEFFEAAIASYLEEAAK